MGNIIESNKPKTKYGLFWEPGTPFKAPDWRQYKVEEVPVLKKVQDDLAKKGLRNPWLRNDVWRYKHWPGFIGGMRILAFRGFALASVLMVFTIAADKMFGLKRDLNLPPDAKYRHEFENKKHEHH